MIQDVGGGLFKHIASVVCSAYSLFLRESRHRKSRLDVRMVRWNKRTVQL